MLSVSRIKSASRAAAYYGKDDYYATGEADAPGLEWGGKAAQSLGLTGTARPEDFKAVLAGDNPNPTGPAISSPAEGAKHHPGWDLTFSAPKSVSVAILVGGDKRLDAAHDRAVQKAMDYAEKHLSFARVRDGGGRREVLTGNLLYARTVHGTSRDGDPQRHTHVVLANTTREPQSGSWRALESLHIYRRRMLLGKIYQAELAKEARSLGHHVRRAHFEGTYELAAWTREQLKVFAKRAHGIEEALDIERPATPAAREAVKLKGRPKKLDVARAELVVRWKGEANQANLDVEQVVAEAKDREVGKDRTPRIVGRVSDFRSKVRAAVARRLRSRDGPDPYGYLQGDANRDPAARKALSFALQVAEVRSAVFSGHEVIERALDAARSGVGLDRLEREMARLQQDGRVIASQKGAPGEITTRTALAIEGQIVASMEQGRGAALPVMSRAAVLQRLAAGGATDGIVLNAGQRNAVAAILSSADRYTAVQGYAGVGKTTMFSRVKVLADEAGLSLSAITPTHRAAMAMGQEAGVPTTTIASWLVNTDRAMKTRSGLQNMQAHWKGRALIIDEASMVSNGQMLSILSSAERIGIRRIVLVGDERQIPSPQAGAPFRLLLGRRIHQARVTQIVRQRDPTLREAVRQLAQGRPGPALNLIEGHIQALGRDADDKAMAIAAVDAWRDGGETARIVVPTNALRGLVSGNVRAYRAARRELLGEDQRVERYYHVRLDGPERFRAACYQPGQRLVFHAAVRSAGIVRGAEATVVGLDLRNDALRVETGGGERSLDLRAMNRQRRSPFQAYWPRELGVADGERMVWERADAKRGLMIGAAFTVVSTGERFWTIQHEDGRTETLRADDPALKFSGYAYAETADRAQGQTYQSVVAVLASRHGEAASVARQYVMQSRPSDTFTLITDDRRLLLMKLGRQDGLNRIALESVDAAMAQSGDVRSLDDAAARPVDKSLSMERGGAGAAKDNPRSM